MANKNIGIIGLLSSVVVSAVLWLPAEGVAGEPYAQAGSGEVLSNSAGECWGAADGKPLFCGEPPDSDGDGVKDDVDRCPNTPKGNAIVVDRVGCLVDSDRDGAPNLRDRCPGTKYGVRVNIWGCALDLDGDGVPYYRDRCQTTPPGVKVDNAGCMVKAVLGDVLFRSNHSNLTYAGQRYLDKLARTLRMLPYVERIRVTGHTDSIGSALFNQRLSEARVRSVMRYLRAKGVSQPIAAAGLGKRQPVASNATRGGRRLNRRVEIELERAEP